MFSKKLTLAMLAPLFAVPPPPKRIVMTSGLLDRIKRDHPEDFKDNIQPMIDRKEIVICDAVLGDNSAFIIEPKALAYGWIDVANAAGLMGISAQHAADSMKAFADKFAEVDPWQEDFQRACKSLPAPTDDGPPPRKRAPFEPERSRNLSRFGKPPRKFKK